jgi:hypothetical protein
MSSALQNNMFIAIQLYLLHRFRESSHGRDTAETLRIGCLGAFFVGLGLASPSFL